MSIRIDDLTDAIENELRLYSQEVADDLKTSVKDTAKACVAELQKTSPVDTGSYRKGWRDKTAYEDESDIRIQIYNKTDYQLTHLLEDGHAKVGGGRVEGKPHIGPAADNAAQLLEKNVTIKVGGK